MWFNLKNYNRTEVQRGNIPANISKPLPSGNLLARRLLNMSHAIAVNIVLLATEMDLLLHSLNSLVGEGLVLEHCVQESASNSNLPSGRGNLQKASSSSVRPWVSGYIQ